MSAVKETYSIIYVYPCLVCGEDTGSDYDLPTTCMYCSGHECEPDGLLVTMENPFGFCSICDLESNLT